MEMGFLRNWFKWSQLVLAMVVVQMFVAGMNLLSKVILSEGSFIFALMAYRHVVAAICVAPFALCFERIKEHKLGWSVWFWLFVNALTGITAAMALFYYGLRDTTATYAANFLNLIPIATFVLSTITGTEKLNLKIRAGKIKCLGVIVCVGGAITTSFYKGKAFYLIHHSNNHHHITVDTTYAHWTRGTVLLVCSCLSYSTWFIGQVKLLKLFPLKYWATMLICIMAALQSTVIGLCLDTSTASWRIGWDLQLVTILYSGALATAATFCLLSWAISVQGPLYPPMFNPLSLIFVAISGALILGEEIRMGTLLGMFMIIVGLYSFLMGKRKETKRVSLPEQVKTNAELTGSQLTAAVVPTTSPDNCHICPDIAVDVDHEDGLNKTTVNPRGLEAKEITMLML
ncbi:PREDICTED: WAT1-related protein At5g64700-like [Fragaria vesca subsp. vesca]|uniref:WAT1-related protein At5g64700-like n=1 Tax=Fragaria vesca subsp. vesca TaxID=101020 RepID=UPI0002C2ECA6|nr:PREDICTED: WAT1-related protein At5g64700-like [Fragaria vesca subsp. vesca]